MGGEDGLSEHRNLFEVKLGIVRQWLLLSFGFLGRPPLQGKNLRDVPSSKDVAVSGQVGRSGCQGARVKKP